ncbi:MAG: SUMF1/EgtB/PvdO family nonheme iron enzyme, partial [Deltaproteobacteria bacterium]|nr:SUMF1/EgtB/PvdO family nonheme iron enzyme [Deltaproteobacteria bacterium]
MRKPRRQKAIFSTIAGIGAAPAATEPILADLAPQAAPEEVHRPPEAQPVEPESVAAKPLKAEELPQMTPPPLHEAPRLLNPKNVTVPAAEAPAPPAAAELAAAAIQPVEAETPLAPDAAEPKTVPEPVPADFPPPAAPEDLHRPPAAQPVEPESAAAKSPEAEVLPQTAPPPVHEAVRPLKPFIQPAEETCVIPSDLSFVYIPAGSFIMGSPENEPGRNPDEQQHEVALSRGFYLQRTPVTQRQWQAVMEGKPATSSTGGDCPAANVSWHECQAFLQKLNLFGGGLYRLPTEAEWEYACRAGGAAALGDRELTALFREHDPFLEAVAWYCGNSARQAHPAGLKNPNAWDLYDMHGNVMEWCQDWYGAYPAGAAVDPTGPPTGVARVIRGGSWFSSAKNCRAACRAKRAPDSRSH